MYDRLIEARKKSDDAKEGIQVYYFERHATPWYKLAEPIRDFYRALGQVRKETLKRIHEEQERKKHR